MPYLTNHFLRVRPYRINTVASIADIATAMATIKPDANILSRGWGNVHDDDAPINRVQGQPPAADPTITPAEAGRYPDTLMARLYWYVIDPSARRMLGTSVPKERYHKLQAVDVLLSKIDGSTDLTLLVSTLDKREVNAQVLPALTQVLQGLDPKAVFITTTSVLDLGDKDFFLWFVARHLDGLGIGSGMVLADMATVQVQDLLKHQTSIARGVDSTRLELLACLADPNKVFGPCRVAIQLPAFDAHLDFTLELDGAFNVQVKETSYSTDPLIPREQQRILAVLDIANTAIPRLKDLYQADNAWRPQGRDDFRNRQRNDLESRVQKM